MAMETRESKRLQSYFDSEANEDTQSYTVSIPDNKMPKKKFSIKIELLSLETIEKWTKVKKQPIKCIISEHSRLTRAQSKKYGIKLLPMAIETQKKKRKMLTNDEPKPKRAKLEIPELRQLEVPNRYTLALPSKSLQTQLLTFFANLDKVVTSFNGTSILHYVGRKPFSR